MTRIRLQFESQRRASAMSSPANQSQRWRLKITAYGLGLISLLTLLLAMQAKAVPAFARQTGQNCVACHAGGQFPELTPYGRLFKLTGYTIGARAIPVSVMGVASSSSISKPPDGTAKNVTPIFATGSLFLAGKITDNIGAFTQFTYDPYAVDNGDGTFSGHTVADNMDFRFA